MSDPLPEILTLPEVLKLLRITDRRTFLRATAARPIGQKIGRRWRYLRQDVLALAATGPTASTGTLVGPVIPAKARAAPGISIELAAKRLGTTPDAVAFGLQRLGLGVIHQGRSIVTSFAMRKLTGVANP